VTALWQWVMVGLFCGAVTINITMLWRAVGRLERQLGALQASHHGHMRHHTESLDRR
jgi:hypothetical protein